MHNLDTASDSFWVSEDTKHTFSLWGGNKNPL